MHLGQWIPIQFITEIYGMIFLYIYKGINEDKWILLTFAGQLSF